MEIMKPVQRRSLLPIGFIDGYVIGQRENEDEGKLAQPGIGHLKKVEFS